MYVTESFTYAQPFMCFFISLTHSRHMPLHYHRTPLQAVNQQRYGAKLDEALAQANGMQTGGDGGKHGGASTGAQAHTTESDNANMHVGSRNIDALRLSEVLGVMQEGLRCAARSSKDLAQARVLPFVSSLLVPSVSEPWRAQGALHHGCSGWTCRGVWGAFEGYRGVHLLG
jgi:hypothetical protein